MKHLIPLTLLSLTVLGCGSSVSKDADGSTTTTTTADTTAVSLDTAEQSSQKNLDSASFDISSIPLSTQPLGDFPYLQAPQGYNFGDYGKGLKQSEIATLDKEYFAVHGVLIPQEGKSCKTGIDVVTRASTVFNSLELERHFHRSILALGGVKVNDVDLPYTEIKRVGHAELIDKGYGYSIDFNALKDLHTYVIRTAEQVVWVQFYLIDKESGRITILEQNTSPTIN